ncbi:hypothetical protein TK90_2765 (plasmid) [Thioalkalivibrio sp. K90mix]|uniref:hypothetical protein n=1 Tax=Thioalkalivibrio sp. (strain K90mix) TaxID=396595 RepID=UPI000195A5F9|nr:hypothetical protein [Thioalkalivibrio sp. K90mix]ADC73250.1 hypothetical protein TK90_2765 [Thioalkalivibrio sp. K90mix]
MLKSPMTIALAHPDRVPDGWYPWASAQTTQRMRRHLDGGETLPPTVTIVRSLPGAAAHADLLAVCGEARWPVEPDELESALDQLANDSSDQEVSRAAAIRYIRSLDPNHGLALWVPLPLREVDVLERGQMRMFSDGYRGRIRYAPEHRGWVAETGSGRELRTLSGGAFETSEAAFDRLVETLTGNYVAEAQALQHAAGGDLGWLPEPLPSIQVSAVERIRDARQLPETRTLAEVKAGTMRWAERILIGPKPAVDITAGRLTLLCPDCNAELALELPAAQGVVRCDCGAEWAHQEIDDVAWLVRTEGSRPVGQLLRPLEREAFVDLNVQASRVLKEHEARKGAMKEQRGKEFAQALELFRAHSRTADLVEEKGLRRGAEMDLINGARVRFHGPVRVDRHSGKATAQVSVVQGPGANPNRRVWLTLLDFL